MKHPPIIPGFRHMIHGADYNPEQWLDEKDTVWEEDLRLAGLAGINSLSVGIFSWAALEPEEGRYAFEWLDEVLDGMAARGMKAVLATPSGSRPHWLARRYPEVLRVTADRRRALYGERHNHCMSSPAYRAKVNAINTRLAERYGGHAALGLWHISNEYGGECHCDLCQEAFRGWLKARYGTLDALNRAWWAAFWSHTYSDWSEIESPSPIGERNTHGLAIDWMRFTTDRHIDFYCCEIEPLKRLTPGVPCTANLMGIYPGIDYFRLAEALDVASWDAYPQWTGRTEADIPIARHFSFLHDLTRSLKRKPFLLMESAPSATNWRPVAKLHRPGVHLLQSMQAVAHGADSVQYFQFRKGRGASEKFHGAVVGHEGGEDTRVFRDVASVGAALGKLEGVAGTHTPSRVAVVYDWNNRWAIDESKGMLQGENRYAETVIAHYGAFWSAGVPVDIVDQTRDLAGYDVLVLPMGYMLRGDFAGRVADFVRAGGTLVATYMTGYVDDSDLCFTGGFPGPLMDVLGVWCEEIDALYPEDTNSLAWNGRSYRIFGLCELITSRGARPLAAYGGDFYAGRPALTVNAYGAGAAYFIAARTEDDFLADFYAMILAERGIPSALGAPPPAGVAATLRSDGRSEYVFLLNFTAEPREVDVGAGGVSPLTGRVLAGSVGLPPHGAEVFLRMRRTP